MDRPVYDFGWRRGKSVTLQNGFRRDQKALSHRELMELLQKRSAKNASKNYYAKNVTFVGRKKVVHHY
jgi:hypothetical protein